MKYSVIIPAFNEEASIANAVKSVLGQNVSRKDFEIIVADNDSTDRTATKAREAGADRVVLEMQHGTNMARNAGYRASRGDIAVFLDADCIAPPDWLSRIDHLLEDPSVVMVSGPYDYGFTGVKDFLDGIWTGMIFPKVPALLELLFGKKAGIIIEGNFAAPRETIEAIGGIPLLAFWGDGPAIAIPVSRRVGKVLFDPSLRIKSSPRRFENENFLGLAFKYVRAYLKTYFSI
jgi:glycosyltransferase involved in cell wall biosynthesis